MSSKSTSQNNNLLNISSVNDILNSLLNYFMRNDEMAKGEGYGKIILFGEHFVVYGLPAVASALGSTTVSEVTILDELGWYLQDDRPETPGYKVKKADQQKVSINNVLEFMNVDVSQNGIKIYFGGDLTCASGIGASAASCTALARAINEEFNLGWDDEKINDAAYEGEKGYHGKAPSGIDNACSTFGGLIWYEKNLEGGPNTIDRLKVRQPVEMVIANTGLTSDTAEVVGDVRKLKEANPEQYERVFKDYTELVNNAKDALQAYDLEKLGELMNQNQQLLEEITVSSEANETLVKIALDNGAYGAKLTGTGRGGNIIALTPGKDLQDKVAKALEDKGMGPVWKTTIGV
ncbi:MAG: mevalonate kinase [Candidatus Hodarchaeales archaeon]